MYCRYCMEKIDDNDKVCKSCGKDLTIIKSKEHKYCKYCHTNNEKDAIYCYKCSADLTDEIITDNKVIVVILAVLLGIVIYYLLYNFMKIIIELRDVLIFTFLTINIYYWLYGIINKRIKEKDINFIALIIIFAILSIPGNYSMSYADALKRFREKIKKSIVYTYLSYHIKFLGRLAFILFLFMLVHFPKYDDAIALSLLFSIFTL